MALRSIFATVCLAALATACSTPSGTPPANGDAAVSPDPGNGPGGDPGFPQPTECRSDSDCGEGEICEGEGCGDDTPGSCVAPAARLCTRDSRAYCGCDGETFRASGSCPGQRYAHKGECEATGEGEGGSEPAPGGPAADGEPCQAAADCQSGVCEGEGCGADTPGTCASTKRACTRDYRPYCGCDGQTFHGSGTCPGQRFAHRGECEQAKKP